MIDNTNLIQSSKMSKIKCSLTIGITASSKKSIVKYVRRQKEQKSQSPRFAINVKRRYTLHRTLP